MNAALVELARNKERAIPIDGPKQAHHFPKGSGMYWEFYKVFQANLNTLINLVPREYQRSVKLATLSDIFGREISSTKDLTYGEILAFGEMLTSVAFRRELGYAFISAYRTQPIHQEG